MRSKTGLSIQFLFIYLFFVYKYNEHCQKCARVKNETSNLCTLGDTKFELQIYTRT